MRPILRFLAALTALLPTLAQANGLLAFPNTADGRQVLPIDLHTHSAFSDGRVWPSLRVDEARMDGLSAVAITEHLEWQPNAADIPHPDRNRPYEIALERAGDGALRVINGAEISRGPGIGHINAVFILDANRLLTPDKPSASEDEDFEARFQGDDDTLKQETTDALEEARAQGAFIFLNHPAWTGHSLDGRGRLSRFQHRIINKGLLDGVEVANGGHYSADAFDMALKYDLAILGASDVHGLTAWDYAHRSDQLVPGSRGARTVTLLLARGDDLPSIRNALENQQTVALNDNQLFGRSSELRPLLEGALSFSIGKRSTSYAGETSVYELHLQNQTPIPLLVRNVSRVTFANSSNVLSIPPKGEIIVRAAQLDTPEALLEIKIEILNAFTAPGEPVEVLIRRGATEPNRLSGPQVPATDVAAAQPTLAAAHPAHRSASR